jgi:three-Cys-motif partner protein
LNPKTSPQVQFFAADGLTVTASEQWFKVKVQVIERYLQAFVGNVAGRADEIIFVDLFAGSGLYSVGHQKEIFPGAALASLRSGLPISQWICCERDAGQAHALRMRVDRYFRGKNVMIMDVPSETLFDKLRSVVPPGKNGHKVAVFCLADPFSIELPFVLMDKLASLGWNFLVPFTFPLNHMTRHTFYVTEQRDRLQRYLGIAEVDRLASVESNLQFYQRLVRTYHNNMLVLGMNAALSVHKLESTLMDLPSYYVGFFSKKISTRTVQQEVQSSEYVQFELF